MPPLIPDNPSRFERDAPVVAHTQTRDNCFEIVFHNPEIAEAARPGQFLELLYNESYAPLIRRPFSVYQADKQAGTFSVLYRAAGSFTSGLVQKRVGDCVNVLGPLGRPYRWDAVGSPVLIAGGIGAPPLCFLASEMCQAFQQSGRALTEITVLNAARTATHLIGMPLFEALGVTVAAMTEDGSAGQAGRVTEALTALLDANPGRAYSLFSCGPMPMLRAIGEIALTRSQGCQLSVETSMPCGIGTCYGCVLPVHDADSPDGRRLARACIEGPCFDASSLLW